jgi:predicted RNase H-like nuclease (RuvC/YqgF family)
MPEYKAGHDYDQEQGNDYGLKYDYGKDQKEENKIRFELKQDIEKLRLELDNAIGTIELQRGEIEASKNQKFEARIVDIEESNKTLKIENEQLRHALTKHSFETASEIAIDPELVKNLEHMISHLESEAKAKQKVIEELNAKIESFSHLDRVVEHQPLEFDLTEKAGFLNQVFSFRYRKCKVIHDGKKVTNITPGVIE